MTHARRRARDRDRARGEHPDRPADPARAARRNSSSTARRTCASRSACRGVRLEVKVHIVTGAVSAAQNIVKCVRRCGLEVNDLILQPLASSRAVLSEDEKDLGVCLLDIGGGTTDIAIFTRRRDPPHRGDPDRRRPDHQRHRDGAAHADRRRPRRSRSATACALRQLADPNEMIEVPGHRRPRAALDVAPDARRGDRAARRGAVLAGAAGAARVGLRGAAVVGDRAHRRLGGDAGHGRARRGDLPHAGARRHARATRAGSPTWCAARATPPPWGCCSRA